MDSNANLHVVFGASGGLGKAVVHELVARGKPVRAVNRSGKANVPEGVETMAGDASEPDSAKKCSAGAAVIYHCANVPYPEWPEVLPKMMHSLISAAKAVDAKIVYGDNLYMYGRVSAPMTEDTPNRPHGTKGKIRSQIADTLMQAHEKGEVQATIGRASDFYGPGVTNAIMGERVFKPLLEGGTAYIIGDPGQLHTYSFIDDVGRALVTLAEHEHAFGEIWHLPSAEPLTARQFLEIAFEESGTKLKFRTARKPLVALLGLFNPLMRELKETIYQFEEPFIVDHSKFAHVFGAEVTPHREAIRRTLEWYRLQLK